MNQDNNKKIIYKRIIYRLEYSKDITLPVFTENPGPTIPVSRNPIECFERYFSDNVIEKIVCETNRYHQQTSNSPDFETSPEAIKAYFGFMILMGICKLPEMRDYWAKRSEEVV